MTATPQPDPRDGQIAERMAAYVTHDHDKAWNACIRNGKPERDDACRRRDLRDCLRAALSPQSVSDDK